jgi:hypothetical protein
VELIHIGRELGLSQQMMLERPVETSGLMQKSLSPYELEVREPPLSVLMS